MTSNTSDGGGLDFDEDDIRAMLEDDLIWMAKRAQETVVHPDHGWRGYRLRLCRDWLALHRRPAPAPVERDAVPTKFKNASDAAAALAGDPSVKHDVERQIAFNEGRESGLEEAAKVAEANYLYKSVGTKDGEMFVACQCEIAASIRALKSEGGK